MADTNERAMNDTKKLLGQLRLHGIKTNGITRPVIKQGTQHTWWAWRVDVITRKAISVEGWRAMRSGKMVSYYKVKQ